MDPISPNDDRRIRSRHPFLGGSTPVAIAHRGGAEEAPENTLEAFGAAVALGYRYLETDAHVSRDGVVVAFHDPHLDASTDRKGELARLTIAEIEAADAGWVFSPDGGRSFPFRDRGVSKPAITASTEGDCMAAGVCSGSSLRVARGERMLQLVLVAILAAALVGLSTLAGRRWGHEVAGVVGAFPLIVGPVLLLTAARQDPAAAATLLGLVTLSGFALAYGRSAVRWPWPVSVALGWAAAAALGVLAGQVEAGLLGALATATLSIALARAALPRRREADPVTVLARWELPARMSLTSVLIVGLTTASERFGPAVAGILAALPTLASVLAVFTHARFGGAALVSMLRGMLGGLAAFVIFCALIAQLIEPAGVAVAFLLATAAAMLAQLAAIRLVSDA